MSDETPNPKVEQPTVESTATTEPATAAEPTAAEPATTEKPVEAVAGKAEEPTTTEKPAEDPTETASGDKKDDAGKTGNDESKDTSNKPHINNHKRFFKKNSKFDPNALPETDDPEEIRKQVEFYFSDSNLGRDQYLWSLTGGPENKPVPLATICSFKRMHRMKPYSAVVKALRDSTVLDITGEDGQEQLTRKVPYDSVTLQNAVIRSVYVKGFGEEHPTTQYDIEAWFSQFNPNVSFVKLRRNNRDDSFKGSVFVEFKTEDEAKAFLALDPPPKWKGSDLKIMSKMAYMEEKEKLIEEGKIRRNENDDFFEGKGGRGRGRGGGGRFHNKSHNSDPNDWKARKAEDRKGGHGGGWRGNGRGRGRGGRGRGGRDRNDRDDRKRSRDDDGANEDRPPKKVDAKTE